MTLFWILLSTNLLIMIIIHLLQYEVDNRIKADTSEIISNQKMILKSSWIPVVNILDVLYLLGTHSMFNIIDEKEKV